MKKYSSSPLPFQGQKRNRVKEFNQQLQRLNGVKDLIIVDLFGGSGLLSHNAKYTLPDATVIYNDYDNFTGRLNRINETNLHMRALREIIGNTEKKKKLDINTSKRVIDYLSGCKDVDIETISTAILFSGKRATSVEQLPVNDIYNRMISKEYSCDGYLEGVVTVSTCYKNLLEKYKNNDNVVFVCDPPYLSTCVKSYRGGMHWKLKDYLEILRVMRESKVIFFSSEKSNLVELMKWMDGALGVNLLKGCEISYANVSVNNTGASSSRYSDIMITRISENEKQRSR